MIRADMLSLTMPALSSTLIRPRHLLTLCLWLIAPYCFSQPTAILIIDDMGNGLELGQRAIRLAGKINYAFLPHTPNGYQLAQQVHRNGKEVLLHLPMSNLSNLPVGPGQLSPIMDKQQFVSALEANLQSIPHVRGVNNHMGSLLTQLHQPMQWLMSSLRQHRLYFIDSRTSPLSVAEKTARHLHLPALPRDVFLDNQRHPEQIERQIEQWLQLAERKGVAVAIGHPHPETLTALENRLPTLKQRGIRLALISEVLAERMAQSTTTPAADTTPQL